LKKRSRRRKNKMGKLYYRVPLLLYDNTPRKRVERKKLPTNDFASE
jgi:hypothetical protein